MAEEAQEQKPVAWLQLRQHGYHPQRTGTNVDDLPPKYRRAFEELKTSGPDVLMTEAKDGLKDFMPDRFFKEHRKASWGSGVWAVMEDGALVYDNSDWDSSD